MTERMMTRIVIACDAVGENVCNIAAAAQLAAAMNAALHGIFVEDEALLQWTALPFARQVSPAGETSDAFDAGAILHHFAAHSGRVRAALESAARARAINWSFDIVRGTTSLGALPVGERDIVVIEAASRPFAGGFRLDSRWLAEAFRGDLSVLLVRGSGQGEGGIVGLLQEAGPSAERVIAAAAALARAGDRRLTLLQADGDVADAVLIERVRAVSDTLAARCRIERISLPDPALAETAPAGSILVVDADLAANDAAALRELAARTGADILLLHGNLIHVNA